MRRYLVDLGGLTERDCPLDESLPWTLGKETWVSGRASSGLPTLCLIQQATLTLVISSHWSVDPTLSHPFLLDEVDEAVIDSMLEAVRESRPAVEPPPAAEPTSPSTPTTLPRTRLVVELPTSSRWRVMPAKARDFDAIVRDVPVLPELQVSIRRHRALHTSCEDLHQRLLRTRWLSLEDSHLGLLARTAGFEGGLQKTIDGFESVAFCKPIGDSLLDVRLLSRPSSTGHLNTILSSLSNAYFALSDPLEPDGPFSTLPPATRRMEATAVTLAGLSFGGDQDKGQLFGAVELGLRLSELNGIDLGGTFALGLDGSGNTYAARAELGVRLGLPRHLSLSVSLGLLARRNSLLENRAIYSGFTLRSDASDSLTWSLDVVPLLLASRQPAISGAPLLLAWQARFASGLLLGVELEAVSRPRIPQAGWASDGVGLGLRMGFGSLSR